MCATRAGSELGRVGATSVFFHVSVMILVKLHLLPECPFSRLKSGG